MPIRNSLSRICGALLGVTLVVGCGTDSGSSEPSRDPVVIGVVAPLSGDSQAAGVDIVNAAKLAAEDINREGGLLLGRKVELEVVNDACDAETGTAAMKQLVEKKVVAVAGGYCSGAAIPETVITDQAGISYVGDTQTSVKLTSRGLKHVFRVSGRDDRQGAFAAQYMTGYLKADNVAIVHDGTTYSEGLAEAARDATKDAGAKTVFYDVITPGAENFTSFLTEMQRAAPEVIYFTGYFSDVGPFIKQARQLGIDIPILGGDATVDTTVVRSAGEAAEGFLATTAPLPSFFGTNVAVSFVGRYKAAYNTAPGSSAPYAYDAVRAVGEAIYMADSEDPEKINDALHNLYGFRGITGRITFDENGDREDPLYVTTVIKDGKFTPDMTQTRFGTWTKAG